MAGPPPAPLTNLELRIIEHCAAGIDRHDSARLLGIAPNRITAAIARACRYTKVPHNQVQLVLHCLRAGLITPPATTASVDLPSHLREVLLLVADGHTDVAISMRLHLSISGLGYRLTCVYRALGAKDRVHAVAIAYGLGLLTTPNTAPKAA